MSPDAPHAYSSRGSLRRRLTSAVLALAVAALVVLGLIFLGLLPKAFVPVGAPALSTFNVAAGSQPSPAQPRPKPQAKATSKAAPPPPPTKSAPKPIVPTPVSPPTGMIVLSRQDFAASDIGKVKGTAEVAGAGAASQGDSPAPYGPGAGPGGKTLYAAEWVREPTDAEMRFYMPPNRSEGWGMIACRTIERNRVDDCQVIGETPGSGIGRGMRQAAWQFLIRPPRVNGKPMIGAWVRIRFDILRGLTK